MGFLKPWHLIILVAVLILLFGAKRLPGAARSLGRSLRIMKAETKGLVDEPEPDDLDSKAEAKTGRSGLGTEQGAEARTGEPRTGEAQAGEVLDPPPQRVRDNG